MVALALAALFAAQVPKDLTGHAGAELRGKIYVAGGSGWANSGSFYRLAWEIDPRSNSWTSLPDLKVARAMAAAAALDGSIYVAGGFTYSRDTLASVERFDLRTRRWLPCASLKNPRSRFALVVVKGLLYAVGGLDGSERNMASVEAYDPARDAWAVVGKLREARHGFAAVADGNRILVFGGYAGDPMQMTDHCESWSTVTHQPEALPAMPIKRGFHGIVQMGRQIVCFGGRPPGDHASIYDPASSTWRDAPGSDLDINRSFSCLIEGRLWMVGGESRMRIPILQSFDIREWARPK